MVNKTGGKKHKTGKKSDNNPVSRSLELKDKDQNYARVTKILGNSRIMALTNDGKEIMAHIPKKFRPKGPFHVNRGAIVLINERSFQTDKCDVIWVYTPQEAKRLYKMGHLNDKLMAEEGEFEAEDEDDKVVFDHDEEEEESTVKITRNQPLRDFDFKDINEISIDDL